MKIHITVYPFATVNGEIEIPDNETDVDSYSYVLEHWDEIVFGNPSLDYSGADYDVW